MQPLQFQPILKQIRWGGTRLGTVLGKPIGDSTDYAESWEISDHGTDQSIVASGSYQGWTLSRLVLEKGGALLGKQDGLSQFPLLIKFLDATDRLSVQVHPNDEQARQFDATENGKTEAWVIIHAEPDSQLYVGLKPDVDRAILEDCLAEGHVEQCLHSFPVMGGECVFIPAGTVHAIGEGVLLAEVQQSSDLTFRLYDWGRVGADGQPRKLHVEQALSCIDFDRGPVDPVAPELVWDGGETFGTGYEAEELVRSQYFTLRRHSGDTPFVFCDRDRFHVLMVLYGRASLNCGGEVIPLQHGQSILLPADSPEARVTPDGMVWILDTFVP